MEYYKKYLKYKTKYLGLKNEKRICLNFLWINREINLDNKYIIPNSHKDLNLIEKINSWIDLGYDVFLWYDENTVNEEQIKNTQDIFGDRITLKSLKKIYEEFSEITSCKLYTKLDFIRLTIIREQLLKNLYKFIIYSDIVISPVEKDIILTNKNLQKYNFLLSQKKVGEINDQFYENSFIVVKNNVKDLFISFVEEIYKKIFIDKTIISKKCEDYEKGDIEIFFDILVIFLKSLIDGEDFDFIKGFDIMKDKSFLSTQDEFIDILPHKVETKVFLPLPVRRQLLKLKEELESASEDEKIKIIEEINKINPSIIKTYDYVIPVIDLERPLISSKYDK
jgi:hypothetical protein